MKFPFWARPLAVAAVLLGVTTPLAAADKIGVVLLHGKLSMPSKPFSRLGPQLEAEGILVDTPEMPWSKNREYDRNYEQAMEEVTASVKRLRAQGATKVVIGGHSMGAAATLIYGSRHPVDGLIVMALGHSPQSNALQERFGASVARARDLAAAGKADQKDDFDDFDASKKPPAFTVATTSRIYLSYFDPDGFANTLTAAGKIPANLPVLWIEGSNENPGLRSYGQKVYSAITSSVTKQAVVTAGHTAVAHKSGDEVLAWLQTLKK